MKIIYSEIKKLVPNLPKSARQVANDLTMIGHFCDGFEKKNGKEVISLEVRQNRGDCLGYFGIAKELSTLYELPMRVNKTRLSIPKKDSKIKIEVTAKKETKRIMAATISGVKNKPSPKWLTDFLALHDIKSINTIVDLTNYIMLWYGIPNHAFDTAKIGNKLTWELNKGKYQSFVSLDGTKISLKNDTFQVSSQNKAVSLAGIVGGKNSAISLNTKETLVEMAIYDRSKVRQDSRKLRIITEASTRLDKELDTELIPQSFFHLIKLITDNCGGKIAGEIFDYYPKKPTKKSISFDFKKPSLYSGVEIPEEFCRKIFKNLGCEINDNNIVPPSHRKDISLEEDLIEEAIRFWGYQKIPNDQPITYKKLKDVTPKIIYLIDKTRNILTKLGYDEIRSWPLVSKNKPEKSNQSKNLKPIFTENSINSNYTALRTSIITSLIKQLKQYRKYKLPQPKFFEIGKVYYRKKEGFCEHYSLGIYNNNKNELKTALECLRDNIGVDLKSKLSSPATSFIEINLEDSNQSSFENDIKTVKTSREAIVELTSQIITLDANIFTKNKKNPEILLRKYQKLIGKNLWQITITDIYFDKKLSKYKYTFQVFYYNVDDKTAKKIHLKAFGLN
jgi:phenylalanyl-tRNA synthetase beta chain